MSINRQTEILDLKHGMTAATIAADPVTVTTSATTIIAANSKRKHVVLQNNSTEPCIIRLGDKDTQPASTTEYNFVLSKATAARDGLGGSITIENYQGAINGICESNSTVIAITEMVKK